MPRYLQSVTFSESVNFSFKTQRIGLVCIISYALLHILSTNLMTFVVILCPPIIINNNKLSLFAHNSID